jgi:hypothetical protein
MQTKQLKHKLVFPTKAKGRNHTNHLRSFKMRFPIIITGKTQIP